MVAVVDAAAEAVVVDTGDKIEDRLCACGHSYHYHSMNCSQCECQLYQWEGAIWP